MIDRVPTAISRFPGLTLTRYSGHCTEADVTGAVSQGQSLEVFTSVRHSIHDFSDCTRFTFTVRETQDLAARDYVAARRNPDLRVAVVTTRPDVSAFVWTYIATDISRYPVIVLPTRAGALEWLERERDVPPELRALLAPGITP